MGVDYDHVDRVSVLVVAEPVHVLHEPAREAGIRTFAGTGKLVFYNDSYLVMSEIQRERERNGETLTL